MEIKKDDLLACTKALLLGIVAGILVGVLMPDFEKPAMDYMTVRIVEPAKSVEEATGSTQPFIYANNVAVMLGFIYAPLLLSWYLAGKETGESAGDKWVLRFMDRFDSFFGLTASQKNVLLTLNSGIIFCFVLGFLGIGVWLGYALGFGFGSFFSLLMYFIPHGLMEMFALMCACALHMSLKDRVMVLMINEKRSKARELLHKEMTSWDNLPYMLVLGTMLLVSSLLEVQFSLAFAGI